MHSKYIGQFLVVAYFLRFLILLISSFISFKSENIPGVILVF